MYTQQRAMRSLTGVTPTITLQQALLGFQQSRLNSRRPFQVINASLDSQMQERYKHDCECQECHGIKPNPEAWQAGTCARRQITCTGMEAASCIRDTQSLSTFVPTHKQCT